MTVPLLIGAAIGVILGILIIAANDRRTQRRWDRERERYARSNGDGFTAWDWPAHPINGHDHPEPPELEHEPA